MKTKAFILTLLCIAFTGLSFAENRDGKPKSVSSRKIQIEGKFSQMTVGPHIKVVLIPMENNVSDISISGNARLLERIDININKHKLNVMAERDLLPGNDLVVYIPVKDLDGIELLNGATLTAEGKLHFEKLTVLINVDSRVELKVSGKIELKTAEDCDFVYLKNER